MGTCGGWKIWLPSSTSKSQIASATNEIIAAFRDELRKTVAVQKRMYRIANFASVLTTAAIVIAAVKL
jgi:uncharacterized membrane protein